MRQLKANATGSGNDWKAEEVTWPVWRIFLVVLLQ